MAEDDKQSKKEEASSKAQSVPVDETPPAPPKKTTTASYSEGQEGIFVFVQAESDSSGNEDDPSDNNDE